MAASKKRTSAVIEAGSTSLPGDFHVSPTAPPGSDSARMIPGISGRTCLEQFGRFSRPGSWARMFADLLVGTEDWYSMRCSLTWRLRDTKYSRFYFQLQVSVLRTAGSASGLLPTVVASDGKRSGDTEGSKEGEAIRTDLCAQFERPGEERIASHTHSDGGPHPEYNGAELSEEREPGYGSDHGTATDTDRSGLQKTRLQQQAAGSEQYGELDKPFADADRAGIQRRQASRHAAGRRPVAIQHARGYDQPSDWQGFPTQSPVCHGDDGLAVALDGITF